MYIMNTYSICPKEEIIVMVPGTPPNTHTHTNIHSNITRYNEEICGILFTFKFKFTGKSRPKRFLQSNLFHNILSWAIRPPAMERHFNRPALLQSAPVRIVDWLRIHGTFRDHFQGVEIGSVHGRLGDRNQDE